MNYGADASNDASKTEYEVQDLSAPCVSGFAARLVVKIVENPLLGYFVKRKTLRDSGFLDFHERVRMTTQSMRLPIHFPVPEAARAPGAPPSFDELGAFFEPIWSASARVPKAGRRNTVREFHEAYKEGRVTPVEVAEAVLRMVDVSNCANTPLKAVTSVNPPAVRAAARASAERWAAGVPLSVLDGVPLFVKDMLAVADAAHGITAGLRHLVESPPPPDAADADVVAALRSAGMIVVGRTHTTEMGMGVRGYAESTGQSRNPWNLNRVSGGSSSGSAAAVAAGLSPIALGSDGGGSVRIPSACCGVFGLKPTFGRVSVRGRIFQEVAEDADPPSTLAFGPVAGCVDDLAIAYYVLASRATSGALRSHPPFMGGLTDPLPERLDGDVAGLRVGVFAPWAETATGSAQAHYRRALGALTAAGASVRSVGIPRLEDIRCAHGIAISSKTYAGLRKNGVTDAERWGSVGLDTRVKMAMAATFDDEYVAKADCVRAMAVREIVPAVFSEVDVVVTPAMAADTPEVPDDLATGLIDAATDSRMMRFMVFANFTGVPAVTVPVGVDGRGMPCSVQVIAGPWREGMLLRVAKCLEERIGVRGDPPAVCFDVLGGAAGERR